MCVCVSEGVAQLGAGLIGLGEVAPPPPGGPAPNRPRPFLFSVCVNKGVAQLEAGLIGDDLLLCDPSHSGRPRLLEATLLWPLPPEATPLGAAEVGQDALHRPRGRALSPDVGRVRLGAGAVRGRGLRGRGLPPRPRPPHLGSGHVRGKGAGLTRGSSNEARTAWRMVEAWLCSLGEGQQEATPLLNKPRPPGISPSPWFPPSALGPSPGLRLHPPQATPTSGHTHLVFAPPLPEAPPLL